MTEKPKRKKPKRKNSNPRCPKCQCEDTGLHSTGLYLCGDCGLAWDTSGTQLEGTMMGHGYVLSIQLRKLRKAALAPVYLPIGRYLRSIGNMLIEDFED